MSRIRVLGLGLVLALVLFLLSGPRIPAAAQAPGDRVPDQYIVIFKDGVANPTAKARGLAVAHGLTVKYVYSHALKGFAAVIPPGRLAAVQADPDVAFVTPDRVVSIAKPGKGKPGGSQPAQVIPTGIDRIDAELSATAKIDGVDERVDVDVAVIDTGIDLDHPDLNVVGGYNCARGKGYDDGNGHGTHVAGTIGALDNDIGVVGVAPGARLWAVRVLDRSGSGTWSSVICGVDWVTANADVIEVANLSLGGTGTDDGLSCSQTQDALKKALCNAEAAGVVLAIAAGNDADDAANHVPAAYPVGLTVSALADFDGQPGGAGAPTCRTDQDDTFADFSNYGSVVEVIAPGVCIYSTWNDGGYNTISGTSMATPHVAGAAALYKATHPGATPAQVRDAILNNGTFDWDPADDPDGIQEPLLNVANF